MKNLLFILGLIVIAGLLSGCVLFPAAQYEVTKYDPGTGQPVAEFKVASRRDIESLEVKYNREKGTFQGSVNRMTSEPSPVEKSVAELLPTLISGYKPPIVQRE